MAGVGRAADAAGWRSADHCFMKSQALIFCVLRALAVFAMISDVLFMFRLTRDPGADVDRVRESPAV